MSHEPAFILKRGTAPKTGPRASGGIGYQILTDQHRKALMLSITSNDGGGYFSNEVVAFQQVIDSLKGIKADQPFAAKAFKSAFKGKSSNNAGFMAAILRAEGLLIAAPDAASQHLRHGDWKAWSEALLKLEGEPYVPPTPKTTTPATASAITATEPSKADAARAKRKGGKAQEDKQLPSSEAQLQEGGDADRQA